MVLDGLVEDILLLHEIDKCPEPPHDNLLPSGFGEGDDRRVLKLEHEKSIVSALSFLTSYTDDPLKVSALCVQEGGDESLIVFIAENTGDCTHLREGIESIASILMKEARNDARSIENEDELLTKTVKFNRARLLCRLRSHHSTSRKSKRKKPIPETLADALERLCFHKILSKETLQKLESVSKSVKLAFDTLEDLPPERANCDQADRLLRSILLLMDELLSICDLKKAVGAIPNDDLSFSETRKTYLVEATHKLSRYVKLGPLLLGFARKYPMFGQISVQTVSIRPQQELLFSNHHKSSHPGLLRRCMAGTKKAKKDADNIKSRLGTNLEAAEMRVVEKSKQKGRIHAEIQLVMFFEQELQTKPVPRIICASKNACYLCNLFLTLHGKFYTPRTHGKIYHQWILPGLNTSGIPRRSCKRLDSVYRQLQTRIEQEIKSSLVRCPPDSTFDNESRIFSIRSLSATEVSMVDGNAAIVKLEDDKAPPAEERRDSAFAMSSPPRSGSSNGGPDEAETAETQKADAPKKEDMVEEKEGLLERSNHKVEEVPCIASTKNRAGNASILSSLSSTPNLSLRPTGPRETPVLLVPGESVCVSLLPDCCPIRLHTRRIHMELDYETAASVCSGQSLEPPEGGSDEGLRVHLTWLKDHETGKLTGPARVFDLVSNWDRDEIPKFPFGSDGFLLKKGKDMVRFRVSRKRKPD